MNDKKGHGRVARWLLASLVLGLAACDRPAGDGGATGEDGQSVEEARIPVETATVGRAPVQSSYAGTATLEPERAAEVVAKTSGVLLRLEVEEGDVVREGQVLARLDPERPRLELARADANLKRLENEYKRAQELFASKLISSEAHDRARFDLETQRAATDLARLELSYTDIVAPIDGVISQRLVKEGNFIQLQSPLFRIDDFDPLLAVLNVPERELGTMRPGLPVAMQVDAIPGAAFQGKVARVSPVVDAATGTFRVTAEFRDETLRLKSGMFGRLAVVYDEREGVLVMPREAVVGGDEDPGAFVIVDGKAVRRTLRLGARAGRLIEVIDGLSEGEQVVTVGASALRDGVAVDVLERR